MSDGFSVKSFVEGQTGHVRRIYSYKGKPCRRVVLQSKLCAQLAGYTLIYKDLRSVLTWLAEIEKRHTDGPSRKGEHFSCSNDRGTYDLIKGLFVAALTFYGKCFATCEGRRAKLERVQLDRRFHALHDDCIAYRHNFAAHSGAKELEKVEVALVFPAKYKKKVPMKVYRELRQPDLLWPTGGDVTLIELVEQAVEVVTRKIELLTLKVEKGEVIPNAVKYLKIK